MCEVLTSIIGVHGIICGNWSYQIIPQPVAEGLSVYSAKYYVVLFHRFQGLGTVPWIESRYQFRVLVSLLHVQLVTHCADNDKINICMRACTYNFFEMFDIIDHAL